MKSLVIRPRFDDVTGYSYSWAEDTVSILRPKGEVCDLGGGVVARGTVHESIGRDDPFCVVHYDHGEEEAWMGGPDERVITTEDAPLLSGRVVYTMNCLSAKKLGAEAWKKKAIVYVGYAEVFAFMPEEEDLFRQAASHGLYLNMSEGVQDWSTIKAKMVAKYDEMIGQAKSYWTQIWLTHDRDALRVIADGVDEPTAECPVSRTIEFLFGRTVLDKLRGIRDSLYIRMSLMIVLVKILGSPNGKGL